MKKILLSILVCSLILACNQDKKEVSKEADAQQQSVYVSIGKEITDSDALAADRMAVHFDGMSVGDTVQSKMRAKVNEVCQAKGCWMKVDLENGEEVMVRFKDYGFFMPKDIAGKEVVLNGMAFVDEMSVEDQRHYAEDGGASEEEIAMITKPKKTYSFEADGVLLKQ